MPFDGELTKFEAEIAPVATKLVNPLNLTEADRERVKKARSLIEAGWIQKAESATITQTLRLKLWGVIPLPFTKTTVHTGYCMVGALVEAGAWHDLVSTQITYYLRTTRGALGIANYNDDHRRKKQDVLDVFDEVLA